MSDDKTREKCKLQESLGIEAWCSREKCIYWRLLEAQDIEASNDAGCGLEHYGIVNRVDNATAEWLLSMKKRLENITPEYGKSRISFRRTEKK